MRDDSRPTAAAVAADTKAAATFEHEQANQVSVGGAIHVRCDSDLTRLVDLEHQIIEDQRRLEGIWDHGRQPGIPQRLVLPRQVAKATVDSEIVVHAHTLMHDPFAPPHDGSGFPKPCVKSLFKEPRTVWIGQRRHRDGVVLIQTIEQFLNVDARIDEPVRGWFRENPAASVRFRRHD